MDMLRVQVAPLYLCHPVGNFLKSVAELGLYGGDAILAMTVTGRGRRTEDGGRRISSAVKTKDLWYRLPQSTCTAHLALLTTGTYLHTFRVSRVRSVTVP